MNRYIWVLEMMRRELACRDMIESEGLRILVKTTRTSQGHSHMQKLCLHAFSLISDTMGMVSAGGEVEVLQVGSMARPFSFCSALYRTTFSRRCVGDCGAGGGRARRRVSKGRRSRTCLLGNLPHPQGKRACLQQRCALRNVLTYDDGGQMALKDVGKEEIRMAPNILKAFHAMLTSTDANVQTFVLRTLGFLAIRNDAFKVCTGYVDDTMRVTGVDLLGGGDGYRSAF